MQIWRFLYRWVYKVTLNCLNLLFELNREIVTALLNIKFYKTDYKSYQFDWLDSQIDTPGNK